MAPHTQCAPQESKAAHPADTKTRPSPAFTVVTSETGERVVHVHGAERTSSGGSVSLRSPASASSRGTISSEESWSVLDSEDDIEPSDSASRSRQPTSRRHTVEARPAPSRHHSSRRVVQEPEELPSRRQSSRRHHSRRSERHDSHSRHGRSSSRCLGSNESTSTVASADDYPSYAQPSMPRAAYPPSSGYRHGHGPAPTHHGYPPSMTSGGASGYHDPYGPPHQALVRMPPDAFGYPQSNPFAPPPSHANPFSPMSHTESSNYFTTEPMAPPQPHRHQRPEGPQRPQSFAAPPSHYPTDIMSYHSGMNPYVGFPAYPGYPPMHGWARSPQTSPPLREDIMAEIRELYAKRDAESEAKKKQEKTAEIETLKELIKKHEEEAVNRQKAWQAEREAEAAAKAAERARAEEEKRRKQEIDDAKKKAQEDAEKKAEEAAKKAKDEHDKKLAEAEKAKEEVDKAKKALEEELAKSKPDPDDTKPPIKFKDAVGRKFSFPWRLCKTWKGMESLIKQAFLHIDVIGDQVHHGHYDLTGPDGEIILPQVWDVVVQPDWEITMHLWPMDEPKKSPELHPMFGDMNLVDMRMSPPRRKSSTKKGTKKNSGKEKSKKPSSPEIPLLPGQMPPPPPMHSGEFWPPMGPGPGVEVVLDKKPPKGKERSRSKGGKEISGLAAWLAGGTAKPARKRT